MKTRFGIALGFAMGLTGAARGADFHFNGYADLRLIVPSTEGSYAYGDLGKLRYGYDDGNTAAQLSDIVGEGRVQILPELMAVAARWRPGASIRITAPRWTSSRPMCATGRSRRPPGAGR